MSFLLKRRVDLIGASVRVGAVLALLAAAGCAKWDTAFRTRTYDPGRVETVTVDAKQRSIIMMPEYERDADGHPTKALNQMRVCAEPSPDVFSALAASGSALVKVDAKSQSGQAQLGIAGAETAASIERTQTVNLLRESFYRTCERYMSGAISRDSFIVQAGRDARAMVAVLAIEQLTGAVRRPSTIITGPATAAQAQAANDALALLGPSQQRARDAQKAVADKQTEINTDCDAKTGDDGKPLSDADKKACKEDAAKTALPALLAASDRADAEVKQIIAVAGDTVPDTVKAATSEGKNDTGGASSPPSDEAITQVAGTVRAIVSDVMQQDDMKLFCIEKFGDTALDVQVRAACLTLMASSARTEAADFEKRYISAKNELVDVTNTQFISFLTRIDGSPDHFDISILKHFIDGYLKSHVNIPQFLKIRLTNLRNSASREEARVVFITLSNSIREDLSKGD